MSMLLFLVLTSCQLHLYSQYLEKIGDFAGAAEHYEKSGCGPVEVTRMYYSASMLEELEAYIQSQVGWFVC